MSRSSKVRVGAASKTSFQSSTFEVFRLTTTSETCEVPFSMTMAKARRSGRGPLPDLKAAYSFFLGSRRVRQLNLRALVPAWILMSLAAR